MSLTYHNRITRKNSSKMWELRKGQKNPVNPILVSFVEIIICKGVLRNEGSEVNLFFFTFSTAPSFFDQFSHVIQLCKA